MPFKKKLSFHTKYMAKIRISEFSAENNFCSPFFKIYIFFKYMYTYIYKVDWASINDKIV